MYLTTQGLLSGQVDEVLDYKPRRIPGSSPTIVTGVYLHVGVYSALPKKVSRCILKVFSPEVYTATFGWDVLQVLVSHHCGKPVRGNKNKNKTNKHTIVCANAMK